MRKFVKVSILLSWTLVTVPFELCAFSHRLAAVTTSVYVVDVSTITAVYVCPPHDPKGLPIMPSLSCSWITK